MIQFQHLANFHSKEGYWHDIKIFKPVVLDIHKKYKPKNMLEIGFNIGYSASMWLGFDPEQSLNLTSVDIGNHGDTVKAANAVKELHKDRFEFILCDSKEVKPKLIGKSFDMAFIDGDHSAKGVENDINLCIDLKIPYLIFDDWHELVNNREVNEIRGICENTFKDKISLLQVYDLEGIRPETCKVTVYKNELIHT